MSRLSKRMLDLRAQGRTALVGYLVAGDPDAESTPALMHALVEGGADVIELGVPFTDPIADGPTIQAACERALRGGLRLKQVFEIVARFRERDADTPVVLMGYLNPLEALGHEAYAGRAQEAGADGLLVVDLPAEEAAPLRELLASHSLELVALVAPTTQQARMRSICQSVSGFVYYVSIKGVTGGATADRGELRKQVGRVRELTDRPVGIGFGINDAATAATLAAEADAIIIGSAIVKRIAEHGADAAPRLVGFLAEIREALDNSAAA